MGNSVKTENEYSDIFSSGRSPLPMPRDPVDAGIERIVKILRCNGVETDQSCEGGPGHVDRLPTVRFNGGQTEGLRALDIIMSWGYNVKELYRLWHIEGGEIVGPQWEIVFHNTKQGCG